MIGPGLPDGELFQTGFQSINSVRLHVARRVGGNGSALPVLCLHGFPDIWTIWRETVRHLPADRLYIMPDQRGYHLSDKPEGLDAYAPERLLGDIKELIMVHSQTGRVVLAGHDWGGVLAAWFAARFPEHVHQLILINAVHPAALQKALILDGDQRAASAYMAGFKSGALEAAWQRDPSSNPFTAWFQQAASDGRMPADEAALYAKAWADPDRWRAAIDWYRASPFDLDVGPDLPDWVQAGDWHVTAPTLLIWGEADPVFTAKTREAMASYFNQLTVACLPDIGHNPLRDAPARVAAAMAGFLDQGHDDGEH